jgi:hypothetical protein
VAQSAVDRSGRELPSFGHATTFYPNTVRFNEAVPIQLDYGKEVGGIDIFLRPIRKVKIRGRVTGGASGQIVNGASIYLQRLDARNHASVDAPARVTYDRLGNFELRDVTPGSYLISAEGSDQGKPMKAHTLLTLPEQDVENLDLLLVSASPWRGKVVVEGGTDLDLKKSFRVRLEPRSERVQNVTATVNNADFECLVWRDETYDVYAQDLPDDFFLSAVRVNGSDVMAYGLQGSLASGTPFEAILDSRGGRLAGRVFGPDGDVWSGASVALVPDPPHGRLQSYREASGDEYGQFQIRGIAPGKYVLIAWLDDPPCDYFDPDALEACRAVGTPISVSAAAQQNLTITAKNKY